MQVSHEWLNEFVDLNGYSNDENKDQTKEDTFEQNIDEEQAPEVETSFDEQPMSDRTLGRFRARCLEYERKTGNTRYNKLFE